MEKKSSHFSGQLGFVLVAAGSAVGVGNLWRFPYLAAKDGGGLFLLIYLALVLTFSFTLLASDIAFGRRTQRSAIGAYAAMRPKWKFLGILPFLVPVLIMTYYTVIGGWITKYAVVYITGQAGAAAQDDYFTSFITSPIAPVVGILFFISAIFATLTSCISVLESIVANCMEIFHTGRKKTVLLLSAIYLAASAVIRSFLLSISLTVLAAGSCVSPLSAVNRRIFRAPHVG